MRDGKRSGEGEMEEKGERKRRKRGEKKRLKLVVE